MFSGVARFNAGTRDLGDWLGMAASMAGDDQPIAVYASSNYGRAWFSKHPGEAWSFSMDSGETGPVVRIRRDPLVMLTVDKLIGSGDWYVLAPGVGS